MKTMLIPIDFTPVTENAAIFGASWAVANNYNRIILLHSFYNLAEQVVVSAEFTHFNQVNISDARSAGTEKINVLAEKLRSIAGDIIVVKVMSELPLLRSVLDLVNGQNAELIVLGADNYNASGNTNSIIAAQIIAIAKISPVKVLAVPADYTYQTIHNVLVPFNFNSFNTLGKLRQLKASPFWEKVKLIALNVSAGKRAVLKNESSTLSPDEELHAYFKDLNHEIAYVKETNIITGITKYTAAHEIGLIIALPGTHSFLYSLTHQSISEAIYKNARVPVLILK